MKSAVNIVVRPVCAEDTPALISIAVDAGLFEEEEGRSLFIPILDEVLNKRKFHEAFAASDSESGEILGWAYFGPDEHQEDVCILWWIGISRSSQRLGAGSLLMNRVLERAKLFSRLVVVETRFVLIPYFFFSQLMIVSSSHLPDAQSFYLKHSFEQSGRVRDFYCKDDDKILFSLRF